MKLSIVVAAAEHCAHAAEIANMMEAAAQQRGTGISRRKSSYLEEKMRTGNAVIALSKGQPVGFSYIETWSHGRFVANSGLIIRQDFRKTGLARQVKQAIFQLSRSKYPEAQVFGITTSMAVMKINSDLGYRPVTFSELPQEDAFWQGCSTCVNYHILTEKKRAMCLCTGMLYTPVPADSATKRQSRWKSFQDFLLRRRERLRKKKAGASLFFFF